MQQHSGHTKKVIYKGQVKLYFSKCTCMQNLKCISWLEAKLQSARSDLQISFDPNRWPSPSWDSCENDHCIKMCMCMFFKSMSWMEAQWHWLFGLVYNWLWPCQVTLDLMCAISDCYLIRKYDLHQSFRPKGLNVLTNIAFFLIRSRSYSTRNLFKRILCTK